MSYGMIKSVDEWRKLLQVEYVDNHKTIKDVAIDCGSTMTTVRKYLKIVGIEIRPKGEWMFGRKLSEETKARMSKSLTGKKFSKERRREISLALSKRKWSDEQRVKFINSYKSNPNNYGKRPWNYEGKTSEKIRFRATSKYKSWRLSVFERDGFKCVGCGDNKGGNLQAHHILEYSKYPEKRIDIDNGTTLCKKCHAKMHPELKFIYIEKETA
jgi:5-methylcytosine-specific restriction endonuclease McrA